MQATDVILNVDDKLPKYQRFINLMLNKIHNGELKKGERLPSIIDSSLAYGLSRDTVIRAYKDLYKKGFLTSIYRKGYFVSLPSTGRPGKKVLMATSEVNSANFLFYQRLSKTMEENNIQCDFKVYHNDFERFELMVEEAAGNYHTFIIDPQLLSVEKVVGLLKTKVSDDGIILLNDGSVDGNPGKGSILLDIEEDLSRTMGQLGKQLNKYQELNLVLPAQEYFPYKLINGFFNFCDQSGKVGHILEDIKKVNKENAYIVIDEKSLFDFMNQILGNELNLGNDVGLLTLFERPYLKYMTKKVTSLNWFNKGLIKCIVSAVKNNSADCIRAKVELNLRESL